MDDPLAPACLPSVTAGGFIIRESAGSHTMTIRSHHWRTWLSLLAIAGILSACGAGTTPAGSAVAPTLAAGSNVDGSAVPATEINPAGDIPDTQVFVEYAADGYAVQVPEGWARVDS